MMRAATSGMFDFARFDPWDMWCWKKLKWTLNELSLQQTLDVKRVEHNHWVTMAAHGNLTPESFDRAKTNAASAMNEFLQAVYPWLADKIGKEGTQTDRDDAIASYQQIIGRPGEPQYEAMIDTILNATKNGKMTQRQKEKDRARIRAARAQEQLEARAAYNNRS